MRHDGGLLIALGAGLGLLVSLWNYFLTPALLAPTTDIAHTPAALLAIAATLVLFLAGLVLGGRPRGAALTTFLVLGALQVWPSFRRRRPAWHRWSGRVLVPAGLAGGRVRTAARMPARMSAGGGGQPGTMTSTGMMFDTRPQLA